jgi:hypothetical protein
VAVAAAFAGDDVYLSASADSTLTVLNAAVSGLTPDAGPTGGGTTVVVAGFRFVPGAHVFFGATSAKSVTFVSSTQLKAVTPAHAAGTVDVTVATSGGTSPTSAADEYVFGAPSVSGVSPSVGPLAAGNMVTIAGSRFVRGASVDFGTVAATSVSFVSGSELQAVAPAHAAGTVAVTVKTNAGTSKLTTADLYAYGAPKIGSFTPASAITGKTVTIAGTAFAPGVVVKFGTLSASTVKVLSGTKLTAVVPNGAVSAPITVSDAQGTATSAKTFIVTLSITGFSPSSGPPGTVVTINGVGFKSGATVHFNGAAASSVTIVSSTQLKATVPSTATSGPITVTSGSTGTVRSANNYTVT